MLVTFRHSEEFSISIYLPLFSIAIAFFLFYFSSLFKKTVNKIIAIVTFSLITLIFLVQTVYHTIFDIYLSVYLAVNETEALQYTSIIINGIKKSWLPLLLIIIPLVLLIFYGRKKWFNKDANGKHALIICLCAIVLYVACIATLPLTGRSISSPYNAYYKSVNIDNSVSALGLLTALQVDLQRNIFGFEEKIAYDDKIEPNNSDDAASPPDNASASAISIAPENVQTVYAENMQDIDFEALKAKTNNKKLKELHDYFSKVEPTLQNEKTGLCKDFNLIMIIAESFSPYAIVEDKTPTLYKMQHEGYNFTNFYNSYWQGSTLAGEYGAVSGLLPERDDGFLSFNKLKKNNFYYAMGNQLKRLGYLTYAFHANTYTYYDRNVTHPSMGYKFLAKGNGLKLKNPNYWPQSDVETIEASVPYYLGKNKPFHAYYMSISGHCNYTFNGNMMSHKNRNAVADMNLSSEAKAYIACNIEFDKSLELLMQKLEEAGVAENTLIMITPDHYPYEMSNKAYNELVGHPIDKSLELYRSTLIMYYKGMEPEIIDTPCSAVDILPTLSNIMGLKYDSRLMSGRDIFSTAEHIVFLKNRSWLTEEAFYNAPADKVTPVNGATVDDAYVKRINSIVSNRFAIAKKILDNNYYNVVF